MAFWFVSSAPPMLALMAPDARVSKRSSTPARIHPDSCVFSIYGTAAAGSVDARPTKVSTTGCSAFARKVGTHVLLDVHPGRLHFCCLWFPSMIQPYSPAVSIEAVRSRKKVTLKALDL